MIKTSSGLIVTNVIVVDDNPEEVKDFIDFLKSQDCKVVFFSKSQDAREYISSNPRIDLAILDYWIDVDNSTVAALLLKELRQNHFVPVVIYSKHKYTAESENLYPAQMYIAIDKAKEVAELERTVREWFETSLHAQLAILWSQTVRKSLVNSMWTLFDVSENGLRLILKAIKAGNPSVQGHYELLDTLQRILFNSVLAEASFLQVLQDVLKRVSVDIDFNEEKLFKEYGKIKQFEMYIKPPDVSVLNTGDIFEKDNKFFVLVTPSCDIYNDKTESLDLITAYEFTDFLKTNKKIRRENIPNLIANHPELFNLHFLPFALGDSHLVCNFHSVQSYGKESLTEAQTLGKKIASLSSPYKEHLVQRYNAAMSRIGVIDLAKDFRANLTKQAKEIFDKRVETGKK